MNRLHKEMVKSEKVVLMFFISIFAINRWVETKLKDGPFKCGKTLTQVVKYWFSLPKSKHP